MIDALASADPLGLPPAEIVERVLALGNVPDLEYSQSQMCPSLGWVVSVSPHFQY